MYNFVFLKTSRVVFFVLATIFTLFALYILYVPFANVISSIFKALSSLLSHDAFKAIFSFFAKKVFKVLLLFWALLFLVHCSFALKNNGFMRDHAASTVIVLGVIIFFVALISLFWAPLIWIVGIFFLTIQILISLLFPPNEKQVV